MTRRTDAIAIAAEQPAWRRPIVIALLAVALAASALLPTLVLGATGADQLAAAANAQRTAAGVAAAPALAALNTIAAERSDEMAAQTSMFHDLDYVKERLEDMSVCWSVIGEIIARSGNGTASNFINMWMNSTPHREILLNPKYTRLGGSWTAASDGDSYAVMLFLKPCGSTSPGPAPSIGRVVFAAGSHTGYRFEGSTAVSSRTAWLASASSAPATARARIGGRVYLKISDGIWAGYWVRETYRSYLPGFFDRVSWSTPHRIGFAAGTHTAYRYDSAGNVLGTRTIRLYHTSGADASGWAIINGRAHFFMANGAFGGLWVPDTASVWRVS